MKLPHHVSKPQTNTPAATWPKVWPPPKPGDRDLLVGFAGADSMGQRESSLVPNIQGTVPDSSKFSDFRKLQAPGDEDSGGHFEALLCGRFAELSHELAVAHRQALLSAHDVALCVSPQFPESWKGTTKVRSPYEHLDTRDIPWNRQYDSSEELDHTDLEMIHQHVAHLNDTNNSAADWLSQPSHPPLAQAVVRQQTKESRSNTQDTHITFGTEASTVGPLRGHVEVQNNDSLTASLWSPSAYSGRCVAFDLEMSETTKHESFRQVPEGVFSPTMSMATLILPDEDGRHSQNADVTLDILANANHRWQQREWRRTHTSRGRLITETSLETLSDIGGLAGNVAETLGWIRPEKARDRLGWRFWCSMLVNIMQLAIFCEGMREEYTDDLENAPKVFKKAIAFWDWAAVVGYIANIAVLIGAARPAHLVDAMRILEIQLGWSQLYIGVFFWIASVVLSVIYRFYRMKPIFQVVPFLVAIVDCGYFAVLVLTVAVSKRVCEELNDARRFLEKEHRFDSISAARRYRQFLEVTRAVRPMFEWVVLPHLAAHTLSLALEFAGLFHYVMYVIESTPTPQEAAAFYTMMALLAKEMAVFVWIVWQAAMIPRVHYRLERLASELVCRVSEPALTNGLGANKTRAVASIRELCAALVIMKDRAGFRIAGQQVTFHVFVNAISVGATIFTVARSINLD